MKQNSKKNQEQQHICLPLHLIDRETELLTANGAQQQCLYVFMGDKQHINGVATTAKDISNKFCV